MGAAESVVSARQHTDPEVAIPAVAAGERAELPLIRAAIYTVEGVAARRVAITATLRTVVVWQGLAATKPEAIRQDEAQPYDGGLSRPCPPHHERQSVSRHAPESLLYP